MRPLLSPPFYEEPMRISEHFLSLFLSIYADAASNERRASMSGGRLRRIFFRRSALQLYIDVFYSMVNRMIFPCLKFVVSMVNNCRSTRGYFRAYHTMLKLDV
jgi:hypothetical protein